MVLVNSLNYLCKIEENRYICGLNQLYKYNMKRNSDIHTDILDLHPDAVYFMNDYFLYNSTIKPKSGFKINTYGCFLCLHGSANGTIDLKPFHVCPGKLIVNVPGQLVIFQSYSDDFSGISLVMTQHFIDTLGLPYNFAMTVSMREHPILELKQEEIIAIQNYFNMVKDLLRKKRPYQAETLRHLTSAYAYSLGSYLYQMEEMRKLSNEEILTQRFFQEVHVHYKKERKISFYAERLNITSGYLSTLVRNITGKTASDWIENFVLLEAKIMLKSTNLTIQQISQELNFPSQTFFGKYFKRLSGISPKEYRENGV